MYGVVNLAIGAFFPANFNQQILLLVGIAIALLGAVSGFKDTVELFHLVSGNQASIGEKSNDSSLSFLARLVFIYKNTRIISPVAGKTYRLFHSQLFITVQNAGLFSPITYIIGAPKYANMKVTKARVGDAVMYEAEYLFDIRIAQVYRSELDFVDHVKFIVIRFPKANIKT